MIASARGVLGALAIVGGILPAVAGAQCKLNALLNLPVVIEDSRALVSVQINDRDERLILDSGAFYSLLSPGKAAELKLALHMAPYQLSYTEGVGGSASMSVATVRKFAIGKMEVQNMEFFVGGNELQNAAGLLGQNALRFGDVEYDLAKGLVRVFKPEGCAKADLAYWAGTQDSSVIEIDAITPLKPHTIGVAHLNGERIRVVFDTGATWSFLSRRAAERAGVKRGDPGVTDSGTAVGVGRHKVESWIGHFASFKIGNEEIQNARLRIGDADLRDWDMLLGMDFFLSHHLFVSNSQHRLHFTYNGGPVFNLSSIHPAQATPADPPAATSVDNLTAAEYARRGTASAARREYAAGIADLTRAVELDASSYDYRYELAMVRSQSGDQAGALNDLDGALGLKPDAVAGLLARGSLHLRLKQLTPAIADLDSADRLLGPGSNERRQLALLYEQARLGDRAIHQNDLWLTAHSADVAVPEVLARRCSEELLLPAPQDRAVADCDRAVKENRHSADVLFARGYVHLQRGDYARAIADLDAALALNPNQALALYVRGCARQRAGSVAAGQADLDAAHRLDASVAERAQAIAVQPP